MNKYTIALWWWVGLKKLVLANTGGICIESNFTAARSPVRAATAQASGVSSSEDDNCCGEIFGRPHLNRPVSEVP
jgi:hypothetical protein